MKVPIQAGHIPRNQWYMFGEQTTIQIKEKNHEII